MPLPLRWMDGSFKDLGALLVALDDPHVDAHGIASAEFGNIGFELVRG